MGGNGSYSESMGGIPIASRTHVEYDGRIEGHKILAQAKNKAQCNIPMNSNSPDPTYLIARVNKRTGTVEIAHIAIYKDHKIDKVIDLKFNNNGDVVPYDKNKRPSSHSHDWNMNEKGKLGRKSHDKNNDLPVDVNTSLITKIVKFNKEKNKWKEKK